MAMKMLKSAYNWQSFIVLHRKLTIAMRYFVQAIEQGYLLNYRVLQAPLFSALRNHHDFKKFIAPKPQRLIDGKRKIGEY